MFCSKCGGQVPDGTRFCPNCGTDLCFGKAVCKFGKQHVQQCGETDGKCLQ